ncbi:MAG TPA: DNA-formamidopyrimidine glycosylase [Rhodospirillaceae bacterium]|nr:MAG: DNA-formamidopyrimidine glycosylase [Alphaproteobacteria bacterium GWF2_58_20]HAU29182.1 DNA-formamidopyrimidine glycosylase [Rhodospirillaceae bacterium]
MPELPEVETIRRGLVAALCGQRILSAELRRHDFRRKAQADMEGHLSGRGLSGISRRGKYMIFHFEDGGEALLAHLGMSGRFLYFPPGAGGGDGRHDHLVLHMSGGGRAVFCDPRRFGFVELVPEEKLPTHPALAVLGMEPLSGDFTPQALLRVLKGRTSIKAALLDQGRIAGLGNIYVCEALFEAGISPFRMAGSLGKAEGDKLHAAIRAILERAIAAGGSSLRDYVHADGSVGRFQEHFSVYGRTGQPCPRCHLRRGGVVSRKVQSGRSSFFCPSCQE